MPGSEGERRAQKLAGATQDNKFPPSTPAWGDGGHSARATAGRQHHRWANPAARGVACTGRGAGAGGPAPYLKMARQEACRSPLHYRWRLDKERWQ